RRGAAVKITAISGSTTFLSKVAGRYGLMNSIYGLSGAKMALCAPTEKLASTRFRQKGHQ
ncbi:hypothetical protein, partial [Franconibacter pulveris]|uniref:hypothetical protein n=1 Tax=Franconibacter pulveris TaxID=435910 RepID=UPI001F34164E